MSKFKVGDYVIVNKGRSFAPACLEYHAVVTEELRKNCYMLHILDEYIRDIDHKFGISRDFKCVERYMDIDESIRKETNLKSIFQRCFNKKYIKVQFGGEKHVY